MEANRRANVRAGECMVGQPVSQDVRLQLNEGIVSARHNDLKSEVCS